MTSKIALIVEWDNARLSEVGRARDMLRQLHIQTSAYSTRTNARFDLLLVYDPEEIAREIPETIIDECIKRETWPGDIRLLEARGLPYYEQKNFGVRQTDADVIFFVDSDVIPDDNWLTLLIDALKNPDVNVVGGETYLTNDTLYEKLFSAFWQFETKTNAGGELREVRGFYANNVAFRGDLLRANPFPKLEAFRGQCAMLGHALRAKGIKIYRHDAARVSHPPPRSFSFHKPSHLSRSRYDDDRQNKEPQLVSCFATGFPMAPAARPSKNTFANYAALPSSRAGSDWLGWRFHPCRHLLLAQICRRPPLLLRAADDAADVLDLIGDQNGTLLIASC